MLLWQLPQLANGNTLQLFHQPWNEGIVRAEPDDLLLLAGAGFAAGDQVVYRAVLDTTGSLPPPSDLPSRSTADEGLAEVVSLANLPNSLTIKLPQVIRAEQSYALWVHSAKGEWSEAVLINDARPLWFTPAFVYSSRSIGSLPRELKLVGRNLEPAFGAVTRIQLKGPSTVTGAAIADVNSTPATNRYAARLHLPAHLPVGRYRVRLSRDGRGWVEVPDQVLEVRADPATPREFAVDDPQFGGCKPDDGRDDTGCILRAIAAAQQAGGGTVYFGPGSWDLIDSRPQPGLVDREGILVPAGVSLRGAGNKRTWLNRNPNWNARAATPALTLIGHTVVSGFTFRDLKQYSSEDITNETAAAFVELGEDFARVALQAKTTLPSTSVEEVVITRNIFDRTFVGIGTAGLPISRLFIADNEFGAFAEALSLTGNRYNSTYPFRIDDSVFDNNVFKPGSLLDTPRFRGSSVSELGASARVDFSGNFADGHSTDFLYRADDPGGWRAAFFWSLNGNVEELLISRNKATCTGDKTGDGEAISFDNNGNTFAFSTVVDIARGGTSGLTVAQLPVPRQNSREIPLQSYYSHHWIQIVSGPGLGQTRKIKGYTVDPVTGETTFEVYPAWDVLPVPGKTRIAVGREYWQVYTVDNEVDERQPLCKKSNSWRPTAGVIGIWAQAADSVIEGNRQYDSDGILTQQAYILPEKPCPDCTMGGFFQYFIEIRGNTIDGEYQWDSDCSSSGISAGIAAAPWNDADPPTVAYGVSISHNIVRHADGLHGGAIAQAASWHVGPKPNRWVLSDNQLIHHNSISDIAGARAGTRCEASRARIGINFPTEAVAWRTVLYQNSCVNVSQPLNEAGGVDTIHVCDSAPKDSCECPAVAR